MAYAHTHDMAAARTFVSHDIDGVYPLQKEPTLVVHDRTSNAVLEKHWLTGPVAAPVYARPGGKPGKLVVYDTPETLHKYYLTGPMDSPTYCQTTKADVLQPSYIWQETLRKENIKHWLFGPFKKGKYGRAPSAAHVFPAKPGATPTPVNFRALPHTLEMFDLYEVVVAGKESAPFMRSGASNAPTLRSMGSIYFLMGNLQMPLTKTSLNALEYRYDPESDEAGFALEADYGLRVWATGTWRFAHISRGTTDLPEAMVDGVCKWLDGYINEGWMRAVYWRRDNKPTQLSASGVAQWPRGTLKPYFSARLLTPLPDRVTFITHLALIQLRGTCYLNASVNILVCTPQFRDFIRRKLNALTPDTPACRTDIHVFRMLHSVLCGRASLFSPLHQSNAMSQLEHVLFPKRAASNLGGKSVTAFLKLAEIIQLPLAVGPVTAKPKSGTQVYFTSAARMRDLPRKLVTRDGARLYLKACMIHERDVSHVVCALADVLGQLHIVLDSADGAIFDVQWWPKVLLPRFADEKIRSVDAVYISRDFGTEWPVRCVPRPLPSLDESDAVCEDHARRVARHGIHLTRK